jgi:hypothetical protein
VGLTTDVEQKYKAEGGKFVVDEARFTVPTPAGSESFTVRYEYETQGGFTLVKKLVWIPKGKPQETIELLVMKVNSGIEDSVFGEPKK